LNLLLVTVALATQVAPLKQNGDEGEQQSLRKGLDKESHVL
jgi:hypothetical protein